MTKAKDKTRKDEIDNAGLITLTQDAFDPIPDQINVNDDTESLAGDRLAGPGNQVQGSVGQFYSGANPADIVEDELENNVTDEDEEGDPEDTEDEEE